MRKITFTFGKKRSYERYYEQYMNLIGMDNLEKAVLGYHSQHRILRWSARLPDHLALRHIILRKICC